jgi:hypothetical protein
LKLAPDQKVELLIGPSQLDIRLQRDGVVTLDQRVEKLMDRDRLSTFIALGEIVTLEHPSHGVPGCQLHQAGRSELFEPCRVEDDARTIRVEDPKNLLLVGLGVVLDLFARKRLTRGALTGGIPDHPGEIAYQEEDLMSEVLQLTKLVEENRMPEMKIRGRWIESRLDPQRATEGQFPAKRIFEEDFVGPALDERERAFE